MIAFKYGFGEHMWNITPDQLLGYLRTLIGICVLYVWTPALSKFSLLVLYHRISPAKTIRTCVYILAALVFGYSLSITIVVTGPCNPVSHPDPSCLKDINLFMAISEFVLLNFNIPPLRSSKVGLTISSQHLDGFLHNDDTTSNDTPTSTPEEAKGCTGHHLCFRLRVSDSQTC